MKPERVLVVDDEEPLRRLLRLYLAKAGFTVVEATTGGEALGLLRGDDVDVALVDVMLPGMDGIEVVRRIRRESAVPIILVSARGEERSRVLGLEAGADDYVVKPFSPPEMVARVRAQLRRSRGFDLRTEPLRVGQLELELEARRCLAAGREVELTRREFDLLAALIQAAGRALTRRQLLERVWGTAYVSENTVDVYISALRRKLGDALEVTALRGVGYRLEA